MIRARQKVGVWAAAIGVAVSVVIACSFAVQVANAEEEPVATDKPASFVAHGSEFGKSETVAVKTDLTGRLDSLSVEEWLKNPAGLELIEDSSSLQGIQQNDEDIAFERNGEAITWHAGGKDVVYTGTSARDLPFEISYTYYLDGTEVAPSALVDVTGKLEVHIEYKNLTAGTVQTNSGSYSIQDPFVMASVISFDAEHARNVSVDNGNVIDQQGTLMAVGLGMPGLEQTLGVEDMVDLPTGSTISAEVTGFDMPDITTIVTSQALSLVDSDKTGDVQGQLDDAIGQLGNMASAIDKLSEGNTQLSVAVGKISDGSAKMAENLPNAADGLRKLADVASAANGALASAMESQGQIAANLQTSVEAQQEAMDSVGSAQGAQQQAIDSLPETVSLDDALSEQQAALETLKEINTTGMDEKAKAAIDDAVSQIEASIDQTQKDADGVNQTLSEARAQLTVSSDALSDTSGSLQDSLQALGGNAEPTQELVKNTMIAAKQTEGLATGLTGAADGFDQVQEGVKGMSSALGQISSANARLGTASKKLSEGVSEALDTVRGNIDEKIDLVNALHDYVESQPAYGGSLSGMPTSTMYVVHAKSELTPLR